MKAKSFLVCAFFFFIFMSYAYSAPPTFITVTSPSDGSYVNNTVTIEAELTQIPQVRSVKFYIDNQLVGEDTTSPYQYAWNTATYPDGQHQIYASAFQGPERPTPFEQANLPVIDSPKINVTVDNTPPEASIITPQNNSFITGSITTEANVTDNFGISKVEFKIDDNLVREFTQSPYTYEWNTNTVQDGPHTFTVIAYDLANNKTIVSVDFIVDNSPPTIPLVSDDGVYTNSLSTLHATFSSEDPHSGIEEYLYSVGTEKTKTDILDWTSSGTLNEVILDSLSLIQGKTYYFNVKAKNGVGLVSPISSSDGIIANDGTSLLLNITSPQNNALFNTPTITVEGNVSRNDAQVTVNGIPATVANYIFSASNIPLSEGTNIITARASVDSQVREARIDVILDSNPPGISIFVPDENSTTRSNIVYGRVSEDTQTVTVNGIQAELFDSRFLARPTLNEGQNAITVQATDKASNINQKSISITYNTQSPKVIITSPLDNSEINISPIKVEGIYSGDLEFILVEDKSARISEGNFIADYIRLYSPMTVITATGYDSNNNKFSDSILINSPQLADYLFTEVSGSVGESDDSRPIAGSQHTLKVTLEKNRQPAPNEEVQFNIIEGNGTLSQSNVFTDLNGQAQVILTTDTNSEIANVVECFLTGNPLVKTTFYVDTKPGQPTKITKITDDSITPVPSATIELIVKLTDRYQNPIPDETINFQITQGTGTLSSPTAITTYYGEAKVNLTCPNIGLILTQIQASSQTVPSVTDTFNITTSEQTTLTFKDIMAKVRENENKIQDFMADVVKTSNAPYFTTEKKFKIWSKGSKSKIQVLSPVQRTSIIEETTDSINLNGKPFFAIEKGIQDPDITTEDMIESYSGDIYVLKTVVTSTKGFEKITRRYIDYSKGVLIKTEREHRDSANKKFTEIIYSYVLIGDVWVMNQMAIKDKDLLENKEYTTTEMRSNIVINSGIPDSVFQ